MFNQFLQSYQILGKENRIKSLWLLIILLSIIALELLNFSLIIPVLTILFDKDSIEKITLISHLENFFGVNKFSLINLAVVFLILIILKVLLLLYFEYKTQKYSREMNVDITEGHFILLAALLYNERRVAATEDEIRSNILKAVETVQKVPTKDFIIKAVDE